MLAFKSHTSNNKKSEAKASLCNIFGWKMGLEPTTKKSSYSTHYQQVATATKEYISKGLQVRAQLLLFEQRYTKIRK